MSSVEHQFSLHRSQIEPIGDYKILYEPSMRVSKRAQKVNKRIMTIVLIFATYC